MLSPYRPAVQTHLLQRQHAEAVHAQDSIASVLIFTFASCHEMTDSTNAHCVQHCLYI